MRHRQLRWQIVDGGTADTFGFLVSFIRVWERNMQILFLNELIKFQETLTYFVDLSFLLAGVRQDLLTGKGGHKIHLSFS